MQFRTRNTCLKCKTYTKLSLNYQPSIFLGYCDSMSCEIVADWLQQIADHGSLCSYLIFLSDGISWIFSIQSGLHFSEMIHMLYSSLLIVIDRLIMSDQISTLLPHRMLASHTGEIYSRSQCNSWHLFGNGCKIICYTVAFNCDWYNMSLMS